MINNFNDFCKLEFNRLLSNYDVKVLTENKTSNLIPNNRNFFINSSLNGIKSSIYDEERDYDSHISVLCSDLLNNKDNFYYNIFEVVPIINYYGNNTMIKFVLINATFLQKAGFKLFKKSSSKKKEPEIEEEKIEMIPLENCQKAFQNIDERIKITEINILNIPADYLPENLIKIYYLVIFNYFIPFIYKKFNNLYINNKTSIDYISFMKENIFFNNLVDTDFFVSKDKIQYIEIRDYLDNNLYPGIPTNLGIFKIIISKFKLNYNEVYPIDYDPELLL